MREGTMPGTVLLLAASPMGKGCLVDAASVLPVLAAVPPPVLAGTDTANVVELADPLDPQAVLTRLRAAAMAPGPLTLFVAGQLQLDRRQRLPHLALARTTPPTVRYTAFPWHWFREELRLRAPGSTTVVLDLRADPETWDWLRGNVLDCGPAVAVYGRIAPPPGRRAVAAPSYMKAVATILRSGGRPAVERLHQAALARIAGDGEVGDLVLTAWSRPTPSGVPVASDVPAAFRDPVASPAFREPVASSASPAPPAPAAPALPAGFSVPAIPGARPASPAPAASVVSVGPGAFPASASPAASAASGRPFMSAVPAARGEAGGLGAAVAPAVSAAPAPAVSAASAASGPGGAGASAGPGTPADPHTAISTAVRDGRHDDADVLAARLEEEAAVSCGAGSDEALHWGEVRADLAMFAGDAERSCRIWMAVAAARLEAGQPVDAPAVEAAVDRAHHQWGRIPDAPRARALGPAIAQLRGRVPGRREGALDHVRQQLRQLRTQG
ncbi:hypothetical protein [Streptomyces rishiriensis]|uniref:Uncharacterized protein n=1 Tax=Streptomyces rishiriensis TaxID=68264 RepID=A0ABU0NSZ5_STRRH|nr:hypothetical protein [Streptomyces rishiriensis]MDQ0582290.1 hypothetical protein [Streptomyces rishiriensis]